MAYFSFFVAPIVRALSLDASDTLIMWTIHNQNYNSLYHNQITVWFVIEIFELRNSLI